MVDVILASDNLTVLGGPETIDVDLNIGAAGARGNTFFIGLEAPSSLTVQDFITPPQIFDVYIVNDPSSVNYLQAYQYLNQDGVLTWTESFKITNNVAAFNSVLTFNSGTASLQVDLAEVGLDSLVFESFTNSFASFNVQVSISNVEVSEAPEGLIDNNPIAVSVNVGDAYFDITGGGDPGEYPMKLPLDFVAAEFSGGSWTNLDGKDVIAHLRIEVVDPTNVITSLGGGAS